MITHEAGSVIAGYRIDSLIGQGGMAVVYRAEDLRLGRKVALKLLSPQLADDEQFRQRFIRESRLAASLDHPNIVPIYGAGEADGQLYIAMRYVVGSDLKGLLAQQGGQLPLDWALRLFGQIGDALEAAHQAGLVHRDVKPANILVAESRERPGEDARGYFAYLTDFGVTKRVSELTGGLTGNGHILGTVDYVSPEQIQGKPVGPGTDIYALGCVLHECLTGQPPFRRDEDAALLWAHLVETPLPVTAIRPEVPPAVDAVVARAMAKNPADRYESCEDLLCELESALDVPARVTAPGGRRTPDSGSAMPDADATSDGSLSEVGTVAEDVSGRSRHPAQPLLRFPLPAAASDTTARSADHRPALADHPQPEREHDAGSAGHQREHVAPPGPLPVADVAAAPATPSVSTEGPRPSGSQRRRLTVRLLVVGAFALYLGAGAVRANLLDPVDATSVVAERADSAGADPFTPPPTPGGGRSEPAPPSPPAGGGSASSEDGPVSGDTPGLFGGTGAEACSPEFMATFFDTHPDRQAAWARAQGIEPEDVASFLTALTPVVLRTDTAVTNHGYRNGRANAYQAVLQAGSAVLVDEYGVPRVRCACGNPLDGPGARDQVRYTGQTWDDLGRRPVTVVEPAPVSVEQFVVIVVQQDTTGVVDRPRGTDGDHDEPAAPEIVDDALQFSGEDPGPIEQTTTGDEGTDEPGSASDGSTGAGQEPAADGTAEEPATDGTAEEPATDSTAEEPATDGSTGTDEGTAGSGEEPVTEGSAGSGEEPVTEGSAGSGEEPVTEGSAGSGEEPVTEGSAGSGEEPAPDGPAGPSDG